MGMICQAGMAAGKLYLKGANVGSVSGFFIESNYFITVAHWEAEDLAGMYKEKNGLLRISQARLSINGTPLHIVIRRAELIYNNQVQNALCGHATSFLGLIT